MWANFRQNRANKKDFFSVDGPYKKLIGSPERFRTHLVCNELGVLTFENLINCKIIKFMFWLSSCTSLCFSSLKIYFMRFSNVKRIVDDVSFSLYDISNILDNEYDAIMSQIFFFKIPNYLACL